MQTDSGFCPLLTLLGLNPGGGGELYEDIVERMKVTLGIEGSGEYGRRIASRLSQKVRIGRDERISAEVPVLGVEVL